MYEEFIANLSEACRRSAPADAGTYVGENGILYCEKCRTPRQTDVTFLGHALRVYCACRCTMEAAERERAETQAAEARIRAGELRAQGINDRAYLGMTFARDDRPEHPLSKAARRYAERFEPSAEQRGLMFMGSVGTGKTFYACCIANAVIDRGYSAWVTTVQPLVRALSERLSAEQTLSRIQSTDLLVLDDLGSCAHSDYVTDKLFEVVDARYRCAKPLIVTTNIKSREMAEAPLPMRRIYDRIGERCRAVAVDGASRRANSSQPA